MFKLDSLNSFIVLAIGVFSALTLVYSFGFMKGRRNLLQYYIYIILTALASCVVALANNLILLAASWGFLALAFYLLINLSDDEGAPQAAKKAFIIIGGSDALMLLGIGLVYFLSGTFQMDKIGISLSLKPSLLPILAYLCLAAACFAKAGVMPFHSWVADCAQSAPLPVTAYLPASLDKLLGIYLLARVSLDMFTLNPGMGIFLMLIGAVTIIAGVMLALVQHNMKKLLGYHAVSQVGYMVLGIGTACPIGIAGAMFHMLNNAVYKSCLFFTAGNVEHKTNTSELDKLGGLAKLMPFTYISALVSSLAISGVPPFNGFVSKWMIYQGLVIRLQDAGYMMRVTGVFCLAIAMFGSGLTLASFMKLIHAVFLGQSSGSGTREPVNEVRWMMWLVPLILAVICALFGVFAGSLPLKYFIFPAVKGVEPVGTWYPGLSSLFIAAGLLAGLLLFRVKSLKPAFREDAVFFGGEDLDLRQARVTGREFYNTVKELRPLKLFYRKAEEGILDIYPQAKNFFSPFSRVLQRLHNGVLSSYLVWCLLGMTVLFLGSLFK